MECVSLIGVMTNMTPMASHLPRVAASIRNGNMPFLCALKDAPWEAWGAAEAFVERAGLGRLWASRTEQPPADRAFLLHEQIQGTPLEKVLLQACHGYL